MARKSRQSRKILLQLSRLRQNASVRYTITPTVKKSDLVKVVEKDGVYTIEVNPEVAEQLVKGKYASVRHQKVSWSQHYLYTPKPVRSLAAITIEDSTKQVIDTLGIQLLEVKDKPEVVQSVGNLVAARAICMAKHYGGRLGSTRDIIGSIGGSTLDLEITPTGEITTTVGSSKTTKKHKCKKTTTTTKTGKKDKKDNSEKAPVEVVPTKTEELIAEPVKTSVESKTNGNTIINFVFNFTFKSEVVKNFTFNANELMESVKDDSNGVVDVGKKIAELLQMLPEMPEMKKLEEKKDDENK